MTETERAMAASDETQASRLKRNHLVWLGPIVVFVGAISYFLYFVRFPDLRDFPWVNLPLVVLGAAISLVGVARSMTKGRSLLGKVFAIGGCLFSLALCGLFCFYIFSLSSQIPGPESIVKVESIVPSLSLKDQNGAVINLAENNGKKAVLVFYRGWW